MHQNLQSRPKLDKIMSACHIRHRRWVVEIRDHVILSGLVSMYTNMYNQHLKELALLQIPLCCANRSCALDRHKGFRYDYSLAKRILFNFFRRRMPEALISHCPQSA